MPWAVAGVQLGHLSKVAKPILGILLPLSCLISRRHRVGQVGVILVAGVCPRDARGPAQAIVRVHGLHGRSARRVRLGTCDILPMGEQPQGS